MKFSLPKREELEPEQSYVISRISAPGIRDRVILVQGVAGSGKTTIALSILRELATYNRNQLSGSDSILPIFITYNQRLVNHAHELLRYALYSEAEEYFQKESSTESMREGINLLGPVNKLQRNFLNIFSFTEFCRHLLPDERKDEFEGDEDCISILRRICRCRPTDLLPDQAFGLITSFLKGNPKIKNRTYEELERILGSDNDGIRLPKTLRQSLLNAKRWLLAEYKERLKGRGDRADLAESIWRDLDNSERFIADIFSMSGTEARKIWHREPKPKRDYYQNKLDQIMSELLKQADNKQKKEIEETQKLIQERGINIGNDDWEKLQKNLKSCFKKYGFKGASITKSLGITLVNPLMIIDEVQDLSDAEVRSLIHLWFHQPHSTRSRLLIFGDMNQALMPTGFTWDRLIEIIKEAATSVGESLFFSSYDFRSAESLQEEGDGTHNLIILPNNYRSSEPIAEFAFNMTNQVIEKQKKFWSTTLCDQVIQNVVDPGRTCGTQILEEIERTKPEELKPIVIAGDYSDFKNALEKIKPDASRQVDERIILLVGRDGLVSSDLLYNSPISVIPLLGAKGLEFAGLVITGLPMRSEAHEQYIDPEIFFQWYMAITRARVRLLLFLSSSELKAVNDAGWNIEPNATVEKLYAHLTSIGRGIMEESGFERSGDYYLSQFSKNNEEKWLREAIRSFTKSGNKLAAEDARRIGAEFYEDRGKLMKALEYWRELEDADGEVRCRLKLGGEENIELALAKAEQCLRAQKIETARSCYAKIYSDTKREDHGIKLVQVELSLHRFEAALEHAANFDDPPKSRCLKEIAEKSRNFEPAVAFNCLNIMNNSREASELARELIEKNQFSQFDKCMKANNLQTNIKQSILVILDEISKVSDPIAGCRCYLGYLSDNLSAAGIMAGWVEKKLEELRELGVFGVSSNPERWFRIGYEKWLRYAQSLKGNKNFEKNIKEIKKLAGSREDLEEMIVNHREDRVKILREKTEKSIDLMFGLQEVKKRSSEWLKEVQRACRIFGDVITLNDNLSIKIQDAFSAIDNPTKFRTKLEGLIEIPSEVALSIARKEVVSSPVTAAKIYNSYKNRGWMRWSQKEIYTFWDRLWSERTKIKQALICHTEIGEYEEAGWRIAVYLKDDPVEIFKTIEKEKKSQNQQLMLFAIHLKKQWK